MNNKMKYQTPELNVIKFEVDKDIMLGEENTDEWVEMSTNPHESWTTIADFEWD